MADSSLIFSILAVDGASRILGKVGGSWDKLALGVAAAASVMVAKTTTMAGNFQAQMTRLTTSAGESQSNLKMVSNGVLAMAGQVGDSTTALSAALYTIESGGQHGADGLLVLKAAAQGAKAENADLATVGDAVTSVLQDYHLKAQDAADVTSRLVGATSAGKTTFQELAGSLSSVLPIASAAHISLNDILAAEASMTVHGMSADQASQNLADTIRHMQNPTQVQAKELAQLGINASDLAGMLGTKGLTGTLQTVSQAILSKMGPSGKVLLGTFTTSQQAAADMKQMIAGMPAGLQKLAQQFQSGGISLGDWRKTLKTLSPDQANLLTQFASLQTKSTGFTDALKSGSPAAQTYSAALAKAMGDSTGLNTALMLTGENTGQVNTALKTIGGSAAEAGGNVKGWSDIQETFNQKLAKAKGATEALQIKIGNALLPAVTALIGGVSSLVDWFGKHNTIAAALGITIGVLAAGLLVYRTYLAVTAVATKVWTAAQWLLNLALDANPVGLLIVGIGLLVAAIVVIATKTTWFQTAWKATWNALKTAFSATVSFLRGMLADLVGAILGMFGSIVHGAASAFGWIPGIGGKLKTASTAFDKFAKGVEASIRGIPSTVPINIHASFTASAVAAGYLGHHATGGTIAPYGWSWVGESGPELIQAGTSGAVVKSHSQSVAAVKSHPLPNGPAGQPGRIVVELRAGDNAAAGIMALLRGTVATQFGGDVQLAMGGAR